jgi:hypothetical protein
MAQPSPFSAEIVGFVAVLAISKKEMAAKSWLSMLLPNGYPASSSQ